MNNSQQIADFVIHWRGTNNFKVTPVGNCVFKASVTYGFAGRSLQHDTTCTIVRNGFDDGKISLEENGPLVAEFIHLDFTPEWQTYEFDTSSFALIVKGKSPKMGGSYHVTILPK